MRADVSVQDGRGWTCLHTAAAKGALDAVEVMLRHSTANLHVKDREGREPLDVASNDDIRHLLQAHSIRVCFFFFSCHLPFALIHTRLYLPSCAIHGCLQANGATADNDLRLLAAADAGDLATVGMGARPVRLPVRGVVWLASVDLSTSVPRTPIAFQRIWCG